MNNIKEISPDKDIHIERLNAVSIVVPLSNPKSGNFVMDKIKCFKCGMQKEKDDFYKSSFLNGRKKNNM